MVAFNTPPPSYDNQLARDQKAVLEAVSEELDRDSRITLYETRDQRIVPYTAARDSPSDSLIEGYNRLAIDGPKVALEAVHDSPSDGLIFDQNQLVIDQNARLEAVSKKLDHRTVEYNEARARAQAELNNKKYQEEYARAAENVALGMHAVADAHPDEKTRRKWHQNADNFMNASPEERDNALKDIGKGLLMIVATPFVLAGLGLYAAGTIVGGVASVLKGIGKFGWLALKKAKENGM